jgi:hypothetical protein
MNYMSNDEKEQSGMLLQMNRWNWTLTITSPKKEVSPGEMWLVADKVIERLQNSDPAIRYAFYICKHYGEDSREHLHGIIYTELKHIQIQACIGAGHHRIKKFTDNWWFSYMLNQSLAGTELTNCEIPVGDFV